MARPQIFQRDVEFRTVDGLTLRGLFYAPIGAEKTPCIIMTHGVCLSLNVPVVKINVANKLHFSFLVSKSNSSPILLNVSVPRVTQYSYMTTGAGGQATVSRATKPIPQGKHWTMPMPLIMWLHCRKWNRPKSCFGVAAWAVELVSLLQPSINVSRRL